MATACAAGVGPGAEGTGLLPSAIRDRPAGVGKGPTVDLGHVVATEPERGKYPPLVVSRPEDVVEQSLRRLIDEAGGADQLIVPRGYPHLGLALLDAVFSLRANYDSTTVPILRRYCEHSGVIAWDQRFDQTDPEHGASALLDVLEPLTTEQRCSVLNRQVAPGTTRRKSDVVVEIAKVFTELDIDTHVQLQSAVTDGDEPERVVRAITGVGPATWRYILNLSGVERSKPDSMMLRWLRDADADPSGQEHAARLVEAAVERLQQDGLDVTVRAIDHLVWRAASGRPLT